MPEIGDYITANGIKNNNTGYDDICIDKSNIIIELPNQHKSIFERLCNIYSDQIDKTLTEENINELS